MNHARYMTWYLRNVENFPTAAKNGLMKGNMYVVTQTAGRQCQPTNSENKHTSGEGRVQAGCEASPQMLIKSQYGSAALASVPTLTWPLKGCIATTMRGRSHLVELTENARQGASTKRKLKNDGRWTRQTAIRLQSSCRRTCTLTM